jgi:hypothetical protein
MRKAIFFLFVGALIFTFAPAAMAGVNNNITYDIEESGHNDYGASQWHNTTLANSPFAGDESWGFKTGMDPFGPGIADTDDEFLPPAYTDPCPADIIGTGYDMDLSGGCPIHTSGSPTDPQTADTATDDNLETNNVIILDDMLAKMFQGDPVANDGIEELLNQQVDILFYLDDDQAVMHDIVDQMIDQDLVYFEGDSSSYLGSSANQGVGIKGRLTSLVQVYDTTLARGGDVVSIDQWVVSYVKDLGGVDDATGNSWPEGGIVSSLSTWFSGGDRQTCPVCSYNYPAGHDPVVKTVPEIDNHP